MAPRRPHPEQGFALLVVFLMASVIAITLYMELPRVAMQAQRDKEEMLIDRGEQYKRAIQLFVNKAKRYPGDIKELESFQNQRFLRKRYIDPMTGKDEWRLIHIQAGVLTDSKLSKPTGPGGKEEPKGPNGFVGELAGLGGVQNPTQGGATSARDRRRASDGSNATMPGTGLPGGDLSGNSVGPPIPGQAQDNAQPQQPGNPQGQLSGQIPGQLPGQLNGQIAGQPGMTIPGQQNGQGLPGQPGSTGQPGLSGQQIASCRTAVSGPAEPCGTARVSRANLVARPAGCPRYAGNAGHPHEHGAHQRQLGQFVRRRRRLPGRRRIFAGWTHHSRGAQLRTACLSGTTAAGTTRAAGQLAGRRESR